MVKENKIETELQVVDDFEENERKEFLEIISGANYKEVESDSERLLKFSGELEEGDAEKADGFLKDKGIPFKRWSSPRDEDPFIIIYDGVRENKVPSGRDKQEYAPLSNIREVIDLLELSEEEDPYADIKALLKINENWINTDIKNMYRYGMKDSIAYSSNFIPGTGEKDNDFIDAEIEED